MIQYYTLILRHFSISKDTLFRCIVLVACDDTILHINTTAFFYLQEKIFQTNMTCTFRKKKRKKNIVTDKKKKINVLHFTTCYNKTIYRLLLRPYTYIFNL